MLHSTILPKFCAWNNSHGTCLKYWKRENGSSPKETDFTSTLTSGCK